MMSMVEIKTAEEFEGIMGRDLAIIFKHSTQCPISASAHREVEQFLAVHRHAPVYLVDVLRSRPVSQRIEQLTKVRHESPQVIVLQKGVPVWHASHQRVIAADLEEALVDFQ